MRCRRVGNLRLARGAQRSRLGRCRAWPTATMSVCRCPTRASAWTMQLWLVHQNRFSPRKRSGRGLASGCRWDMDWRHSRAAACTSRASCNRARRWNCGCPLPLPVPPPSASIRRQKKIGEPRRARPTAFWLWTMTRWWQRAPCQCFTTSAIAPPLPPHAPSPSKRSATSRRLISSSPTKSCREYPASNWPAACARSGPIYPLFWRPVTRTLHSGASNRAWSSCTSLIFSKSSQRRSPKQWDATSRRRAPRLFGALDAPPTAGFLSAPMLVDSHCHLDFARPEDREGIVARARRADVRTLLTISTKLSEFPAVRAIAESDPDIWCSVGIHPHEAATEEGGDVGSLATYASHPKVIGIGESGLDFHYDHSPRDAQVAAFRHHARASRAAGVPLIVHSRGADAETVAVLEDEGVSSGVI